MRPTDPLTKRQLEVLRWIADGCPDGVMDGHAHKLSARALEGRRAVKISNRHGVWSAVITENGRYYLEHGSFPPRIQQSAKRQLLRPPARRTSTGGAQRTVDLPKEPTAAPKAKPTKPQRLSPTEQLVADVVAGGGRLKEPRDTRGRGWRGAAALVANVNRYGKTPPVSG